MVPWRHTPPNKWLVIGPVAVGGSIVVALVVGSFFSGCRELRTAVAGHFAEVRRDPHRALLHAPDAEARAAYSAVAASTSESLPYFIPHSTGGTPYLDMETLGCLDARLVGGGPPRELAVLARERSVRGRTKTTFELSLTRKCVCGGKKPCRLAAPSE